MEQPQEKEPILSSDGNHLITLKHTGENHKCILCYYVQLHIKIQL